jgi:hypothetical protein
MNGIKDCPAEAKTSDFLEKFIFISIEPALTREFEVVIKPVENNCQKAIPSIAKIGYGTSIVPNSKMPERLSIINVPILITGTIKAQKTPTKDCL